MQLKFTSGQKTGDAICFSTVIVSGPNILEYPEQFQVLLNQSDNSVHISQLQESLTVTIYENPSDGK